MSRRSLPIVGQEGRPEPRRKSPSAGERDEPKLCPSFSPRVPGVGVVFGLVGGDRADAPEMVPLETPEPVTQETFEMVEPLHPSEVFRIAAPCVEGNCKNYGEGICHLGRHMAKARRRTFELQACSIRSRCVWWHQEGPEACRRCPGVLTNNSRSKAMRDELGR